MVKFASPVPSEKTFPRNSSRSHVTFSFGTFIDLSFVRPGFLRSPSVVVSFLEWQGLLVVQPIIPTPPHFLPVLYIFYTIIFPMLFLSSLYFTESKTKPSLGDFVVWNFPKIRLANVVVPSLSSYSSLHLN